MVFGQLVIKLNLNEDRLEYIKQLDDYQLNVLIHDALHEFVKVREFGLDFEKYVNKGYPWMNDEEKKKKIKEVQIRCGVAEAIRNSIASVELDASIV